MPVILQRFCIRGTALAILLVFSFPLSAVRAESKAPFAGWPRTWVDAYERFEAFNSAREKYFPAADLEISPDGRISHSVQLLPGQSEHLDIDFFQQGGQFLGTVLETETLFGSARNQKFPQKTFSAVMKSCGLAGYQYLYPLIWFETYSAGPGRPGAPDKSCVRRIPPPQPAEDFWPNERLFKFLDFHMFPNRHRDVIFKTNARVAPNVTLRMTNSGVISRDKIDPELEGLLRWRIYHNGKLIEKGPAGGVTSFSADRGAGTYQVFLGVDGPAGFMPVSNLLEFPLFPDKSGGHAVFPLASTVTRFPDFLLEVLSKDDMEKLMAMEAEEQNDSWYYSKRSIYFLNSSASFGDKEKDQLYKLWIVWGWDLATSINNTNSPLGGVSGKPGSGR